MPQLSNRLGLIPPSPTLALDAKAKALKANGQDVISFGVGEPDFETPSHICQAAIKAIENGFTRYTPADGILELKEAICQKFHRDNGFNFTPSQIVVSNGGKHSLFNVFLALFQPGDEVIIPTPAWVSYPPMVTLTGATPVLVKTTAEGSYRLTAADLEKAITPNTKGIIINSPSNPTGMGYSAEDLKSLVPLIAKHKLWVVSDDIYEKMVFDNFQFNNILSVAPELKDQVIITHGLSKTYAMTGWRIGFMAAPEKVAKGITNLQSQTTSNPCSVSQKAGVAALNGPQDAIDAMVKHFDRRRKLMLFLLNSIPDLKTLVPQGAFYVFSDFSAYFTRKYKGEVIGNSDNLADYLLSKAGVALVPGTGFGDESALRLSYAVNDADIERGLVKIKKALAELN